MNKQVKYPVEAIATLLVLFTLNMKMAMVFGIVFVFGDILLHVLKQYLNKTTASMIGGAVVFGIFNAVRYLTGFKMEIKMILAMLLVTVLLVKYHYEMDDQNDQEIDDYLFIDAWSYGLVVLFSIVRQYLTDATIFTGSFVQSAITSSTFSKTLFALIGAGIIITIINKIFDSTNEGINPLWVCLPIIAIEAPFVLDNVNQTVGMVIGIIMSGIIYYTLKDILLFSKPSKYFEGLPSHLVVLGMIYMIVSVL